MEIIELNRNQDWWDKTANFAKNCTWGPGRHLAERMAENDFIDWERIFIAVEIDKINGFCVFEDNGNIPEQFNCHPFINLVYVDENARGKRVSEKLIAGALSYAKQLGYSKVYLKSEHHGLYEKYGFKKIADFEPTVGLANQLFEIDIM